MTTGQLNDRERSRIGFVALEAVEAAASFTGLTGDSLREEIGEITAKWREDLAALRARFNVSAESSPNQAASEGEEAAPTEVQLEAVAIANAHLNNVALPTIRDLEAAVSVGPSKVIGYDSDGQRQEDFAFGWNSAKEQIWGAMRGTVLTQRAINNAEDESGG
jgi:hypothetical protein